MIRIKFMNGRSALEFPKAETIKEAVEQAVEGYISLSEADLRGADLSGATLGCAYLYNADLRNADLRNADLYGAHLRGADLSGADLRGARLSEADLKGAHLRGAHLRGIRLREADLRGAFLDHNDWPPLCQLLYHAVQINELLKSKSVNLADVIELNLPQGGRCGRVKW